MKVLVIDNEPLVRKGLVSIIENAVTGIDQIQEAEGVATGLAAINSFLPDVVLLDVELDDGTAMDLLHQLQDIKFTLIFVTAYNQYAIDAFKFSAIDFLLKPVDPEALRTAFEKARNELNNQLLKTQLQVLRESLDSISYDGKKIVLKDINSIYFIGVNNIIRCESHGQYTEFHCTDQKIVVSKSLKEYQEMLQPYGFLRSHHSHLINQRKVMRFEKGNGGLIVMENGDRVPVSHRKKNQILAVLNNI